MTLAPVAAAPLLASGTSGQVSNPVDHAPGSGLDGQLQVDEGDATGIAGDVQLSDARTTFHGESTNDSLGETVAGIGDVTGDGTDDVALGAPEAADGAGAVYHFFGPVAEGDLNASEADLTVTGAESGDWAGTDVAAADLTGDGMRDLVIGAPQANAGTGAVYVFYGADLRAAVDDGASEVSVADASVTMTGDNEGGLFGTAVAAHGHEHAGDDAPMLAVGAPGVDGDAGAAYTFSDVTSDATASDANAVVTGPAQGDRAGWSLAMADNYTDGGDAALIVGAPQHADTGAVGILTDVSGDASVADADRLLLGESEGDRAGWAVDEAGDVDGDGLTDVVIGAPLNDASAEDAGAAYVVRASSHQAGSMNLSDADAIVRGEDAGDTAGYDVSAAGSGDVTCDEYDDVLVGAPGHDANGQLDAGAAYIVAGGDTLQGDYSLSTAQAKLHGENAGDLAGFSVADAMDVTDNGDEDVLVGAPGADKNAGAAYLVEGQCPADGVEEEPRTDEPVVEEPKEEEPAKEEPKEEEPAKEEPKEEEPKKEEPKEEKPDKEEPAKEEPAKEEPKEEEPKEEEPPEEEPPEEEQPEAPGSLKLALECADDGTVTATLTNPNDAAVTVTAEHNGSAYDEFTVDANETVTVDGLPDGDWTFSAMIDDRTVKINDEDVFSATIDCEEPKEPPADDLESLTLMLECAEDGTVTATFTNPNDENVTVTAEHNGSAYATFDVGADDTLTLDGLPDGDWEFSAETDGGENVRVNDEDTYSESIDCDDDGDIQVNTAAVSEQCEQLTVTNPSDNDEDVDFRVRNDSGQVATVQNLAPGESHTFTNLTAGDYLVDARSDGEQFNSDNTTVNDQNPATISVAECEQPPTVVDTTAVSQECGQLTVTNPSENDEDVDFRIRNASTGDLVTTVNAVSPGDSEIVDLSGGNYLVDVRVVGAGEPFGSDNATVNGEVEATISVDDCPEQPTVVDTTAVSQECGQLTVTNPSENDEDVDFRIRNDSGFSTTVDAVAPGEERTVDNLTGGDYFIDVRVVGAGEPFGSDNATVNGEVQATISVADCPPDGEEEIVNTTAVSQECGQLTVTNPSENDEDVDFRIRNDSGFSTTVDAVAPGESETIDLSGGGYFVDVRVVGAGEPFGSDNATVNGEVEATISVAECVVACPSGLQIKYDIDEGTWDPSDTQGIAFRGGGEDGATFYAPYEVDVYVFGGNVQNQQHSSVSGEFMVHPVERPDKEPAGISHVWIVCPGADEPTVGNGR